MLRRDKRTLSKTQRIVWGVFWIFLVAAVLWVVLAPWPQWLTELLGLKNIFINTIFNGITLGGLYFLVASGFTLIFGADAQHQSCPRLSVFARRIYRVRVATATGGVVYRRCGRFFSMAIMGIALQYFVFRRMAGQDLRQTLVTIGISIVLADLMLAIWTGTTYQFALPEWLFGTASLPIITSISETGESVFLKYPVYRLAVLVLAILIGAGLWIFLNRTQMGVMVRAEWTIGQCFRFPVSMSR